jgi:hypothetical protein
MADIVKITDHVDRMKVRLTELFASGDLWNALVEMVVGEVQDIEDAAFDLLTFRHIDDAYGALLDQWGSLLNEEREGLEDNDYRAVLRARLIADLSMARRDDFVRLLQEVTGSENITIETINPLALRIAYDVSTPSSDAKRARIARLLVLTKAAGYRLSWVLERPATGFLNWEEAGGPGWGAPWAPDVYHNGDLDG